MKNYVVWLLLMIIGPIGTIAFANSDNQEWETQLKSGNWRARAQAIRDLVKTKDTSNETKIKLFLSTLADEMQKPPSGKLIENGYITEEEYFKRQYMFAVEKVGKNHLREIKQRAKAIKRSEFARNQKLSVEWDNRIALVLGLLGEREVLPKFREILSQSKDGDMRQLAAHVVKVVKDKQAIPQLKIALNDPYSVTYHSHGIETVVFPVRFKAAAALIELGVLVDFKGNGQYSVSSSPTQEK